MTKTELWYAKEKSIISRISCACGCGKIVEIFRYQARPRWIRKHGTLRYMNGHNQKGKKQSREWVEKRAMKFRKRVKANCDNCGKQLEIRPCEKSTLKHHFCNRDCYCEWQEKTNWFDNRDYELTDAGRKILSEKMKGKKNPQYKKWQKLNKEEKIEWIRRMRQSTEKRPTSPEQKLIKIVELFNLPLRYTGDGTFWLGCINPDFICRTKRIIVEIFGDYWHNRLEVKIKDEKKKLLVQKYGWKRIIIWEKILETSAPEQIAYELTKRINQEEFIEGDLEIDREAISEYWTKYCETNKEAISKYWEEYRKDKNERHKKYREANKVKTECFWCGKLILTEPRNLKRSKNHFGNHRECRMKWRSQDLKDRKVNKIKLVRV